MGGALGGTSTLAVQGRDRIDRKHKEKSGSAFLCGAGSCEQVHVLRKDDPHGLTRYPHPQDCTLPCSGASTGLSPRRYDKSDSSYRKLDLDSRMCLELDEETTALNKFDFEAFGTVPTGWVRSTARVPDGFLYVGGSATVIEREVEDDALATAPRDKRVLLALSDAAVDMQRAKWLSRRPGFNAEAAMLCHLWRFKECKAAGVVVFEFDFPRGVSLSERLAEGRQLSHARVQALCRSLLKLVTSLGPAPLRLLGFIDASMVFLSAEDSMEALVPLGCLLSFRGAQTAVFQASQRKEDFCLAPELKMAMVTKDRSLVTDLDMASVTDAYAIAVLALRALGQERMDGADMKVTIQGQTDIPPLARDMLQKALHHEPDWRLSGDAALSHPWLREEPSSARREEDTYKWA